ncbi:MAG TPA: HAD-IIB family hydrolase [Candidatus Saccharimonadales bacterium]|nr:HAD-IIB family hydrolase [Candidatus Saccharimonadales bacterium]
MKITKLEDIKDKDLIVFDIDGTLASSKSTADGEMISLMENLLKVKRVAVIGGGNLDMFKKQLLNNLKISPTLLKKMFLFPTTATTFLRYDNGWKEVYSHNLTQDQIDRIMSSFEAVFAEIGYKQPKKTYGKTIENRNSQVTWSAVGQDVVDMLGEKGVELKNKWRDENTPLKLKIAKLMQERLPDLEVHAAGFTSIDITKKGIDKAYGLKQIEKYLKVKIKNMLFIGDAIFPGGNDYAVTKTAVDYVAIENPEGTKKVINYVLKSDRSS